MKKKTKCIIIIITLIVLLGTISGLIDYNRVKQNKKPLFMVSLRNDKDPLNYIGLGYRMQRFTGLSPKQKLSSDVWVKFGSWFYTKEIKYKSLKEINPETDNSSAASENNISCGDKDFEMNLYTDKKVYKTTDKIDIWSTIKYVGAKDKIKLYHPGSYGSDTYFYYTISDGEKFNIDSVINMMAKTTNLVKNKLYKHDYVKSGGFDADAPDATFWEEFFEEKNLYLPEGEYTITTKSAFSVKSHSDKGPELTCKLKIEVEK